MQQVKKIYDRINFMMKYRFSVYNHSVPTPLMPYAEILHTLCAINIITYALLPTHTMANSVFL